MRKKIITTTLLLAMMSLSLAGCGDTADDQTTTTTDIVTESQSEVETETDTEDITTESDINSETDSTETDSETSSEVPMSSENDFDDVSGDPVDVDVSNMEQGSVSILGNDKVFTFNGTDFEFPFTLQSFLDSTGFSVNKKSEENAISRIVENGRYTISLDDAEGNATGIIFEIENHDNVDVEKDGVTQCKVTDFDIDMDMCKMTTSLKDSVTIKVPGGAAWDSSFEKLVNIYGAPSGSFKIGDTATYYEFEYRSDDDGTTYEVKAFFKNGEDTPYRYMYDVIY